MRLSDRLEAILSLILPGEKLLDVGCDHAYLSIEAIRRGIVPGAVASDVRKGPLERAKAHVREAQMEEKILLRLCSGLDGFSFGEAGVLVIAGMGGILTVQILEKAFSEPENGIHGLRQILLEPQSDLPLVREMIRKSPFHIEDEFFLRDRGKDYFIMDLRPGRDEAQDDPELSLPLLRKKDPAYMDYLERQVKKNLDVLSGIETKAGEAAGRRREELEKENRKILDTIDEFYR